MAQQILERGKTFFSIRVPQDEVEELRQDIARRLGEHPHMVLEAQQGEHVILIVTLASLTPSGSRAFDQLIGDLGDVSQVRAVADNPAVANAELDF